MRNASSWAVVILGILVGSFIFLQMPAAIFVIGSNDTELEILSGLAIGFSVLPANVLAIFRRKYAGIWLISAGSTAPFAAVRQELFMADRFQTPFDWPGFWMFTATGLMLIANGTFYVITSRRGWPELKKKAEVTAQ